MIKQFISVLIFLFLSSGSAHGSELEVKKKYYSNGNLKSEIHYKNSKIVAFSFLLFFCRG